MLLFAWPSVAVSWLVQNLDTHLLLAVPAPAWAVLALVLWWLAGRRAGLVVLVAAWTLARAGWLIETRLPEALAGRDVVVRGVVCDFPKSDAEATRFVLERSDDASVLPQRLHLSWYDDAPELAPGQRWQLEVRLKPPHGFMNPGGFDFEQWLYQRGIGATGYVRRSALNAPLPASAADCPVGRARAFLAGRIGRALDGHRGAGWVLGVAVGATHRITTEEWDLMRDSGTTHLLAISGLNIAMVAMPILALGPVAGRLWPGRAGRRRAGMLPALIVAAGYSALSGFEVSTVRALVMLSAGLLLASRRRSLSGPDLLGAAALFALLVDPSAIVSAGFWLSYVAVGWLFVATPQAIAPAAAPAPAVRTWLRAQAAGLVRAQVVLGLGLAPLAIALFQRMSLVAPFANLVAVPVFSVAIMPLALAGTALVVAWPAGGGVLLGLAADAVVLLMDFLNLAVSGLAAWRPPWSGASALAFAAAGAALLCWWRPVPGRALGALLLLPALAGVPPALPPLRVTVLDVGQGLAVIARTPHHALLYDAGPAFRLRDAGESVVLPVLARAGVRSLDALMISHDDQDHAGGAASVLARFPRARVIAPAGSRLRIPRFESCRQGMRWTWDGVRFEVLSPAAGASAGSDNDGSCVLRIEAGASSILLPGDIERGREDDLVRRALVAPVDVVVAPHHGSRSSSGERLVAATRPRLVIASTGYLNRWRFPAAEVVARWTAGGACVLDTASSGALTLDAGDDGWRLARRERRDGARLWTSSVDGAGTCAAR